MNFSFMPSADVIFMSAINKWGTKLQIYKLIEELNELSRALVQGLSRETINPLNDIINEDIIDETADVYIMLRQLEIIISEIPGGPEKLQERVDFKINRLRKRLYQ